MCFGQRLKTARKNKNFTQQDLAQKLGIAKSTLAGYEIGNREPDIMRIKQIINVLDVSGEYLLGMSEIDDSDNEEVFIKFNQLKPKYKKLVRNQINELVNLQIEEDTE